ncbi:A/G-specific adenine glycosylase [Lutibaculum baratangense]|uniref:Adenine DNA glycosylase n=1 Tax=Lutibaculum baratangense AMV1 TaxID=631454 RepID=V4RJE0_9HYPH|nr:A/G-specific adenine glycosylase [Lutibaculum baratangense]ESR26216.1 A/G-specific adenine glycosylase [Lutibaculum baratangense AMV1]
MTLDQRNGNFVTAPSAADLLAWYDRHRRSLPWRAPAGERPAPYRVWLSEIMLQQTTVAAVAGYFVDFIRRWPSVEDLAAAPTEEVMSAWAGLGYYARARNLHACAKVVAEEFDGRFPDTEQGLRALPGIGPYTAGAIAAIAFDRRAAAVDGNVERVMSRVFRVETPMPQGKPEIRARTEALVPEDRPGDFAQALMDLGATICTPRKPACALCPWMEPCQGRAAGVVETLPRKAPKAERPVKRAAVFWAEAPDGSVLLARRPPKGLLGGTEGPWSSELTSDTDPAEALVHAPFPADWARLAGTVEHGFTHFTLQMTVFAATGVAAEAPAGARWATLDELKEAGLPTALMKPAAHALAALHGPAAAKRLRKRPK